jgi:tetratricopeptide (TPR) repeat protein
MKFYLRSILAAVFVLATVTFAAAAANLTELVKSIQPTVATIVAYDMNHNVANIGTGFFVNKYGHLITNHHVLVGRFGAEIRTADGNSYRIRTIVAENEDTDLIKVSVDIPPDKVRWLQISEKVPPVAEKVVVVGSPMGLEQSVSDGIISSVRKIPGLGTFFQMSAPISPGSSGSPVVNMEGRVVGVASFQFLHGQNLNFAVSSQSIRELKVNSSALSLSEWTFSRSDQKSRLAAELCRKGYSLSINGQDQEALQYFKMATENDPGSTSAWYGLGYCYAGKDSQTEAIAAYKQAIETNPTNALSHYHLGNYYNQIGRYNDAVRSLERVVAINPEFEAAYFNLGIILNKMGRYDEGRAAFESVIRINPQAQNAYYNIGVTYAKLGQYTLAASAYEKAIAIRPEFPEALFNLGIVYGELGNAQAEMSAYKKALRINPDFAPAHFAIGQIFLEKGDKAAALDEYKILQKLDDALAEQLFKKIYQ